MNTLLHIKCHGDIMKVELANSAEVETEPYASVFWDGPISGQDPETGCPQTSTIMNLSLV